MSDDHCSTAAELLVDEDFEGAVDSFTKALAENGTLIKALTGRSQAFLKLKRYKDALQDANAALKLDVECELAYFRKGIACFELEEFETSLQAFKKGKSLLDAAAKPEPAARPYLRWIRKCETEIDDDDEDEDLEESPPPPSASSASGAGAAAGAGGAAAAPPAPAPEPSESLLKYQFYQSNDWVTLSIMEKKVQPDELDVVIEARKLNVTIKRTGSESSSKLSLNLFDEVDTSASTFKVLGTKVEIKLKKVEAYQWSDVKGGGAKRVLASAGASDDATNAPLRPYASKKDWTKVDKVMQEELEKDKPEGEEALNELFKSIYGKANEDTRRAMNKSFQTSGGTVLSTNWSEVGEADYEKERQAPSGMQWKNWEGEKLPQKDD